MEAAIERLTDPKACRLITDKYPEHFTFNAEEWFSCKENYAFVQGENVAFGEWKSPGVYWVHFCFHTAKGREAIELTKNMFSALCSLSDLKIGIGLIHHENRKAKWLIRQVGFKSLGMIETSNGLCEMFTQTNTSKGAKEI